MRRTHRAAVALLLVLSACGGRSDETEGEAATTTVSSNDPQSQFWVSLMEHCGNAYRGRVVEAPANDTTFADKLLIMHVRECGQSEIRIPFHVGRDRSRTWVLTRTSNGLRLKHDHRHQDGTEDEVTMYGGDTARPGTATSQEFPADAHTARLIPEARTNFWTVEIQPGQQFVYALRREGTDRRFRIEFDLTRPVETPPAPWGADDGGEPFPAAPRQPGQSSQPGQPR